MRILLFAMAASLMPMAALAQSSLSPTDQNRAQREADSLRSNYSSIAEAAAKKEKTVVRTSPNTTVVRRVRSGERVGKRMGRRQ